jgi:hypothetical protein
MLKGFGNWRAKFKAEPQPPARKVLYRRGVLSHALSQGLSQGPSHDLPVSGPIVPPAREGRHPIHEQRARRRYNVRSVAGLLALAHTRRWWDPKQDPRIPPHWARELTVSYEGRSSPLRPSAFSRSDSKPARRVISRNDEVRLCPVHTTRKARSAINTGTP